MKERNIGIDIIKCLAALLITNSHFDILYGKYSFLSSGGCFGDALFFFCSGFTLFLKPIGDIKQFPNWYKRRINRIYPSVFAIAIIACFIFDVHWDIVDILFTKRYWFISCIMLYYIAIYFIGHYLKNYLLLTSLIIFIFTCFWFTFVYQEIGFTLYGGHKIRWLLFFDVMLMGATIGSHNQQIKCNLIPDNILLIINIITFYVLYIYGIKHHNLAYLQLLSFFPLLGTLFFLYKICNSKWVKKIFDNIYFYFIIRFIGGLCLEIYLVQQFLISDSMNHLFPFNIVLTFILIILGAYITRCFAIFISQTFKDSPYDWTAITNKY